MADAPHKPQENDAKSNYMRVLSHQLKSPINSIQSLLKTISDGFTGEIPPKTLYFIEKAINRADEAKHMISDLLDYEMYAQSQTAAQEEFDLVDLLHTLVNMYALRASEKNISLQAELPRQSKIIVLGDHRGLEHVFRNIIENAIKYTPEQGSVTVRLIISDEEDAEKQTCQILVSDTGYGIPKDEIDTIFEPFHRSIKHKSHTAGTGLGLAIAKRVTENHHGKIAVESEENQGTTFTITLPYIRKEAIEQTQEERTKVVIIGGVTAGPKAAARLRRLDEELDITIIERSEFLSYTGCGLPSFISGKVDSPKALMSTADNNIRDVHFFESIKNITVLNNTIALAIDREKKIVTVQNLKNRATRDLPYNILILATGSEFEFPQIPGIWQKGIYSIHSLEEAKAIKREFSEKNAQDVFIIGAGLIGTSTAESLIETGARVTILENQPYILSEFMDRDIALKIQQELNKKGIKVLTKVDIQEIERKKRHLVVTTQNDSLYTDLIILATGLKPNTILAQKAKLEIGESGGIVVNSALQTSDKSIYAIGDCAENLNLVTQKLEYWPLGGVATKMGRIAADVICGREAKYQGFVGTAMFKIFDLNVARTGLTERRIEEQGYDLETVTVSGLDKAHYFEDANYIILKVLADKKTRFVLGAQGYGKGDVVSKIQILACAITQSLTLEDVFNLDLGYAPPFNTPIDLVQTACLVLNNKIDNLISTIDLEEFEAEKEHLKGIVDVSPFTEYAFHSIPGSLNIPLENLRREGIPFDKNAKVVLYSKTSSGAYQAYRYLITRGFTNLYVLEGGYIYWER